MANELQTSFEKLTNQARFVQMIVNRELVVSNRKKVDIVLDLRKHKFRPFPKGNAKTSGEAEPTAEEEEVEEEEGTEADSDFDYLLGMAIWSLTKEKVGDMAGFFDLILIFGGLLRSNVSRHRQRRRRLSCLRCWKDLPRTCGTLIWTPSFKNGR